MVTAVCLLGTALVLACGVLPAVAAALAEVRQARQDRLDDERRREDWRVEEMRKLSVIRAAEELRRQSNGRP